MDDAYARIIGVALFVVLGPVIGMLLAGVDRRISARMQGRRGPPLTQPMLDVRKFMAKERSAPNRFQDFYVACYLIWVVITGALFFGGMDLLLVLFTLSLAETFLVLAAYCTGSPFAQIGAQREAYAAMAFEPIVLIMAVGYYLATGGTDGGTFSVLGIAENGEMMIVPMLGIFVAFLMALTIKLRKSPFDLSMSHHAHQDLVRGLSTEFSGRTYAALEVSHWFESVMILGMVALFLADGTWTGALLGLIAALLVWVLEIWIDNGFARMKWQSAIKFGWAVSLILGLGNIAVLLVIA